VARSLFSEPEVGAAEQRHFRALASALGAPKLGAQKRKPRIGPARGHSAALTIQKGTRGILIFVGRTRILEKEARAIAARLHWTSIVALVGLPRREVVCMSAMLTIRDESASGELVHSFSFALPWNLTTVRELIRARVHHEVTTFNARSSERPFIGLVQPSGAERVPKGYKVALGRSVDWHEQFRRAVEGFERNQFFILVDDRQVENLDEALVIRETTKVSFVKLVPLVGG
jgi:hypothetical protein